VPFSLLCACLTTMAFSLSVTPLLAPAANSQAEASPADRILFGGCLVKSASSTDLGNVTDAKLADWRVTMEAVLTAYPSPRLVIPGHGDPGDRRLLQHTLDLALAAQPRAN